MLRFDPYGNRVDASGNRVIHQENNININCIYDSGWEKERFVDNVESCICGICLCVFRDATTLQCGHTYCSGCSTNLNRCALCRSHIYERVPDYAKRMMIMGFTVSCSHADCPVKESLRLIHHHERLCDYRVVPCPDCQTEFPAHRLDLHHVVCEQRSVTCEKCTRWYPLSRLDTHLCTHDPVHCDVCNWTGKRFEQEQHDQECLNRVISCPLACYGCTYTGTRNTMLVHLDSAQHVLLMSQSIEDRLRRIGLGL